MTPELPASLLDAGLELAGFLAAEDHDAERSAASSPEPDDERLGAHSVLSYAAAEGADTYRRIMRVLYLEHQAFGLRLRPAQVADRLRERYGQPSTLDWLEERLTRAQPAGARSSATTTRASPRPPPSGGATATRTTSLRPGGSRRSYSPSSTRSGRRSGGSTPRGCPRIRDALARLGERARQAQAPTARELRELLRAGARRGRGAPPGALAFMRSLGELMRTVEQVGEEEFERGKGGAARASPGLSAEPDAVLGGDPGAARADRRARIAERSSRRSSTPRSSSSCPVARRSSRSAAAARRGAPQALGRTPGMVRRRRRQPAPRGGPSTTRSSTRSAPSSRSPSG